MRRPKKRRSGPACQNRARATHITDTSKAPAAKSVLETTADNASPFDRDRFERAVLDTAATGRLFTIPDVLVASGIDCLDHKNRVGALTAALAKSGRIVRVTFTRSTRPAANGHVVTVWRGADR